MIGRRAGRSRCGPSRRSRTGRFGDRAGAVAFLAFTGIDSCAKWLVLHGVPAVEVAFVRYAVHLGIVLSIGVAAASGCG